jgi:uncharacterized protein
MNCPVCKVPLIAVERDRIEMDYCISCHGLWFDSGEVDLLGETLQIPLDLSVLTVGCVMTERPRDCPRCGKIMIKCEIPTARRIIVDRCPDGEGIWFDAQELGAFIDYSDQRQGNSHPVASFLGETFGRRI